MMVDMVGKLKTMDMTIFDNFLVHFIKTSLPSQNFEVFKVNYNLLTKKWNVSKLIAKCVQKEERQKADNKDQVNLVGHGKRRNRGNPSATKKLNFLKAKKQEFKKSGNAESPSLVLDNWWNLCVLTFVMSKI